MPPAPPCSLLPTLPPPGPSGAWTSRPQSVPAMCTQPSVRVLLTVAPFCQALHVELVRECSSASLLGFAPQNVSARAPKLRRSQLHLFPYPTPTSSVWLASLTHALVPAVPLASTGSSASGRPGMPPGSQRCPSPSSHPATWAATKPRRCWRWSTGLTAMSSRQARFWLPEPARIQWRALTAPLNCHVGFQAGLASLLQRGFRVAYCHVRGGGELGERWHRLGRQKQKPNSFADFQVRHGARIALRRLAFARERDESERC
jgi:hypothetical protein